MKKRSFFKLFGITLVLNLVSVGVEAQVIPDNTLGNESSVVIPVDSQMDVVGGGAIRGTNLFHSFQEFSIQEGRAAYFANPEAMQTIFSRVTGNNPSRLFGTLGVLGNANLFFINPNGIIFGPNAKLDISGSFIGSTANSIIFPDGDRFSATNPNAAPLLTIDVPVPLGLEFEGGEPGSIINSATLEPGGNLALVGGTVVSTGSIIVPQSVSLLTVGEGVTTTIQFDNEGTYLGQITQPLIEPFPTVSSESKLVQLVLEGGDAIGLTVTPQGQVSLAGTDIVVETGDIVISGAQILARENLGGNATLSSVEDVHLIEGAGINVRAGGEGNITINAQNVEMLGTSKLRAGIDVGMGSPDAVGGDVVINATESVTLNEGSSIANTINNNAVGTAGNINITTNLLSLNNNSQISTTSVGVGNAGNINITVADVFSLNQSLIDSSIGTVFIEGTNSPIILSSKGNAGNILVNTGSLNATNGGRFWAQNWNPLNPGNGGNVQIAATGAIIFEGVPSILEIAGVNVFSGAGLDDPEIKGNGGNIDITANSLLVTQGARVATIALNGNSGNVTIAVKDKIILNGESNTGIGSRIGSTALEGKAGDITITTPVLEITDGALVNVTSLGGANAGNIFVNASDSVVLRGTNQAGLQTSGLLAQGLATGDSGNITVSTTRLQVQNGARISTLTTEGRGGNLEINASESVYISGISANGERQSQLQTSTDNKGNAGNLTIQTQRLIVDNGAAIGTSTFKSQSQGNAGILTIQAERVSVLGGEIQAATQGEGQGGTLIVNAFDFVEVIGGRITTQTQGTGNAGTLTINTRQLQVRDGGVIEASTTPNSTGNGGSIFIDSQQFTIQDDAIISVNSNGEGVGGNIEIVNGNLTLNRGTISAQTASTTGGNITLNLQNLLTLRNESQISTTAGTAQAGGDGGNITINSPFIVTSPFENSDITANAFLGNGGNINITTLGIFGLEVRDTLTPLSDITASSALGLDGNINIDNLGIDPTRGIESLPQEVVNPQVFQGCQTRDGAAISEFYRLGRGGIPSSPDDWFNEVPFGNEGLMPLEIPLNKIPVPINWQEVPIDSVSFSCQRSL